MSSADEKRTSREIDAQIAKDREQMVARMSKEPKVLLLGSGDSGKTTFMKQLKIIHGNGYSSEERAAFLRAAHENILDSAHGLILAAAEMGISPAKSGVEDAMENIKEFFQSRSKEMTPKLIGAIETIWADENIRSILPLPPDSKVFIQDTAAYFLSKVRAIGQSDHVLTDEDILNIRLPTTQITETVFVIEQYHFHIYDVAGQQKHRKHWIPFFDSVNQILFFISLASYDQFLVEDPTINRMHDALGLFGEICNHPLLKHIPITLFMNKMDLFETKLQTSQIKRFFPDFNKENNLKYGARYFEKKFRAQYDTAEVEPENAKLIYCHLTCCTDTKAMGVIISNVLQSMLVKSLRTGGLM
ncbi:hypothetical protein HK105_203783 [Polyrhizophydium stewartii]|uniref:Uncharacterized protein n=1 Tax=Polyrhizophydium stewartii TaxID=2732419 RepID=A0ABR4NB26_9FUNG